PLTEAIRRRETGAGDGNQAVSFCLPLLCREIGCDGSFQGHKDSSVPNTLISMVGQAFQPVIPNSSPNHPTTAPHRQPPASAPSPPPDGPPPPTAGLRPTRRPAFFIFPARRALRR